MKLAKNVWEGQVEHNYSESTGQHHLKYYYSILNIPCTICNSCWKYLKLVETESDGNWYVRYLDIAKTTDKFVFDI